MVAGNAEAAGVRHGRKEGADTNVPAWLINGAQISLRVPGHCSTRDGGPAAAVPIVERKACMAG